MPDADYRTDLTIPLDDLTESAIGAILWCICEAPARRREALRALLFDDRASRAKSLRELAEGWLAVSDSGNLVGDCRNAGARECARELIEQLDK